MEEGQRQRSFSSIRAAKNKVNKMVEAESDKRTKSEQLFG
jgi:hypothetical protein